jgi:YVTN family beta-propeller protein
MRGGRQAGGRLAQWMLALVAALGVGSLGGAPSGEARVALAGGVAAEPITIPVGENPFGIALHPSSPRLYVANYSDDTVSVIDPESATVVATIPVADDPSMAAVRGDRVYVADGLTEHSVAVIDSTSNQVIRTIGIENGSRGITTSPDTLFVCGDSASGQGGVVTVLPLPR